MTSSSHPKFINQEGLDVEEELSETESQAAARKQVEAMDMEACLQDQADQRWDERLRRDGQSSLKSYQGSVRSMRREEYKRKD